MTVKEFIEIGKELVKKHNIKTLYDFFWKTLEYKGLTCVARNLYPSLHPDYMDAIDVYSVEDGFVGVNAGWMRFDPAKVSWDDVDAIVEFTEFEAVVDVVYRPKYIN